MFQKKTVTILLCVTVCAIVGCYTNLVQRAKTYEDMGDYGSAIASYQKAARTSNPQKKAQALGELGRLYTQFGTKDYYWKAEELLKEAKQMLNADDPLYPNISYYLGYCYYELGTEWVNEAISHFEDALRSKDDHLPSHFYLGTLYYRSGAYKQALVHLNRVNGTPHDAHAKYIAGMGHWKLGEHREANEKLVAAIQSESDATKQRIYQEAASKLATEVQDRQRRSAKIVDVQVNSVLAALYRSYDDTPIGTVTLRNPTTEPLFNPLLKIEIPDYMDTPTVQKLDNIAPGQRTQAGLTVKFNAKIFDVTENIENHPIQITLEYTDSAGQKYTESKQGEFFSIYNRNVTFWEPVDSIVSFISPQNPAVQEITRTYCNADNPIEQAIQIYDALQLYGIKYLPDPDDPYGQDVDTVFYPWETLKFKKGDCDDLSVLYVSCLHNVGIKTALLLPADHIYMMFDSKIPAERAKLILPDESLYTVVNGTAWIPVEVTMLGKTDRTFFHAWQEGARIYREEMERVNTDTAWQTYKTASSGTPVSLKLPDQNLVSRTYYADVEKADAHWLTVFKDKATEYQERLNAQVVTDEPNLRNLLGVTYARTGEFELAEKELQQAVLKAPTVAKYRSNLANVLLLLGRTDEALVAYEKALETDPKNVPIYFNLSLYHFMLQDEEKALATIARAKQNSNPDTISLVAKVMGVDPEQFGLPETESPEDGTRAGITIKEEPQWLLNWLE